MNRTKIMFFFISLIIIVSCSLALAEESISITTYYPSPYGVYNEMRLYPHATPITSCDSTTEGTMFYNSTAHELQVCNGSGVWKSGGGFWAGSGNDIYNTNSGNIGIEKNNPTAKLHLLGDDPAGGNPLGTGKWFFAQGTGESEDSGKFWIQYGQPAAPLLVMSDQDDPSRIQFQQPGTGTASAPQYSSWIGMSKQLSSDISIMGGNVGIGTMAPAGTLALESVNPIMGEITFFDNTPWSGDVNMTGGTDSLFTWYNSGVITGGTYFRSMFADPILYLKNDGNVGFRTMTPQTQLHLKGANGTRGLLVEGTSVADAVTENAVIFIKPSRVDAEANLLFLDGAGNKKSLIHTGNNDVTETIAMQFQAYGINAANYGTIDFTQFLGPRPAAFPSGTGNGAGGQSRLFINSAGNIGIGDITPEEKLTVNGVVKATSFIPPSDIRLKENIQPVGNALDKIMKLNGVTFTWKENKEKGMGVIAQDVEKVFPEIVRTGKESGMKGVNYDSLIAPLIESIKEQQKQINDLKAQINELQGK